MNINTARVTATESDRTLIAHALSVAGDLKTGIEPTDSARFVIVELCKRLHLRLLDMANATAQDGERVRARDAARCGFAAIIGAIAGAFAMALAARYLGPFV